MTDCEGTWRAVAVPDETGDLHANRCDGCGEIMVVVRGRGSFYPAGTDLETAVRDAVDTAMGTRA